MEGVELGQASHKPLGRSTGLQIGVDLVVALLMRESMEAEGPLLELCHHLKLGWQSLLHQFHLGLWELHLGQSKLDRTSGFPGREGSPLEIEQDWRTPIQVSNPTGTGRTLFRG